MNMIMKKTKILAIFLILVVTLCACGAKNSNMKMPDDSKAFYDEAPREAPAAEMAPEKNSSGEKNDSNRKLIVTYRISGDT